MPRKPNLKSKETYRQTIYKQITGSGDDQDAETQVTVHHDAVLVGVDWAVSCAFTTTADFAVVELSESGNFQGDVSDQPDTLALVTFQLLGSAALIKDNGKTSPMRIPFRSGDKIYLNTRITSTRVVKAMFVLHWE